MAETRKGYHINDVDPIVTELQQKTPVTVFYMAQTYNLGKAISELIGMGMEPNELKKATAALVDHSVQQRLTGKSPLQG